MPTKKAPRTATDATGASPAVVSTQTLLAPREPSPSTPTAAGEQQLLRETAHQTEETARSTGLSADGPPRTPGSDQVLDAVVTRVISTLDVDGLSQEMTTKLADQMLGRVKVDALVSTVLEGQADALTSRLTERLIARLLGLD